MKLKKFYTLAFIFVLVLVTGLLVYSSVERERKEDAKKELDILRLQLQHDSAILEDKLK